MKTMADTASEQKQYLHHYTTQEGLFGILKDRCLRASHFSSMSDNQEARFGIELLKKISTLNEINRLSEQAVFRNQDDIKIFIDLFHRSMVRTDDTRNEDGYSFTQGPYISCFNSIDSKLYSDKKEENYVCQNGLLSMWRYFGDNGYLIKFDQSKLEEILVMLRGETKDKPYGLTGKGIIDVYYKVTDIKTLSDLGNDEGAEDLKKSFEKFWTHAPEFNRLVLNNDSNNDSESKIYSLIKEFYSPFYNWLIAVKRYMYHEEREKRIVILSKRLEDIEDEKYHYKVNMDTNPPKLYIDIPLELKSITIDSIIKEIVISPDTVENQNRKLDTLRAFLHKEGIEGINVVKHEM